MTAKPPTAPQGKKPTHKSIPVDKIDRDTTQPREHFDETSLNELALSMSKLGQLQPISVRYNEQTRRYTLIMGERRWRAAKIAGIAKLDAVVSYGIPDGDRETLAKAVAENVGRADMTPMEEAKGFQRLVDFGYPLGEVAAMCGKSESYVGWRIDLLKLDLAVQEALIKGHIPVGLAWFVCNLFADNQRRFLAKWTKGEFATASDAQAFAIACRTEEERMAKQGEFFVLAEEQEVPEGQKSLFAGLAVPAKERERIAGERNKLVAKMELLSVAGQILSDLAAMDTAELATLLAGMQGGLAGQRQRIDHLKEVTNKAVKTLREAQAVAAVRAAAVRVDPELSNGADSDA